MNRNKPELLVTAGSLEEIQMYVKAGADAVNIGENNFGVRMPGNFTTLDIKEAIETAHRLHAKVYVSINNLYHNDDLEALSVYLQQLSEWKVDAVVFGDPAIIMLMKELNIQIPLHWNAEMLSTNYATATYWERKGANRVVLARELNLEEIHDTKRNLQSMEVQVQVHGMTNIYHSRRELLQNYAAHQGKSSVKQDDFSMEKEMYLVEEEREGLQFPIFEDDNGTHVMSAEDICLIEVLDELLEVDLDSLKIEGIMKSAAYNEVVIACYREAIDQYYANPEEYECNPAWLERIKKVQDEHRELTFGFLFKEQVY
ncbi:peptidase U32 family protein [Longirhabdus pacifica]|uniref:peptidase U32 family protein n=1 Tax=Longirhabdus pacifica TaxID=2305227 RepID=UPI001F0C8A31|nr:peptidase U32 family protein [Longirhabdus pacifica]